MASTIDQLEGHQIGVVTNIQFYSINDGPGIRTTVFLKGCNVRCRWCHNPEGVRRNPEVFPYYANCVGCEQCLDSCPSGALTLVKPTKEEALKGIMEFKPHIDKGICTYCLQCVDACPFDALVCFGDFMTVDQVLDEVEKDKLFYKHSGGGMTISGGEPMAQPDFVLALLKEAKERKINTCLDSNGYAKWELYEKTLDYVDWYLLDIKHMDPEVHKDWAGVSNERVLDNIKKIAERGKKIRIRIPVIPSINDSVENMKKTAEFVESLGSAVEGVDLLPYHPWAGAKYRLFALDYNFPIGEGYDEDHLLELMEIFEPHTVEVTIGG